MNKQSRNATSDKRKIRYDKTVQITTPVYKSLKLYSFQHNVPIASIVTKSVKKYLNNVD